MLGGRFTTLDGGRVGWLQTLALALLAALSGLVGCATARAPRDAARPPSAAAVAPAPAPARHVLREAQHWWLHLAGDPRFDASGLSFAPNGDLLVVSDRGPQIYRVRFGASPETAELELATEWFSPSDPGLRRVSAALRGRLDCEGLAFDAEGRLYLCEESRRLVLRCLPGGGAVETLNLDWAPVAKLFSRLDNNASFEGIAVGDGRLYLANERDDAAIIVVDLASLRVLDSFTVRPARLGLGPLHYSDLCWHGGHLFVLLRHQRVILEVEPATRRVLAEYDFAEIENADNLRYHRQYPTGVMEGLAVDAEAFWLASDNNGEARVAAPQDRRPVLLRLPRPGVHSRP